MEEMAFEGGQLTNANLGEYLIPSVLDMSPHIDVDLLEDASGDGHEGSRHQQGRRTH